MRRVLWAPLLIQRCFSLSLFPSLFPSLVSFLLSFSRRYDKFLGSLRRRDEDNRVSLPIDEDDSQVQAMRRKKYGAGYQLSMRSNPVFRQAQGRRVGRKRQDRSHLSAEERKRYVPLLCVLCSYVLQSCACFLSAVPVVSLSLFRLSLVSLSQSHPPSHHLTISPFISHQPSSVPIRLFRSFPLSLSSCPPPLVPLPLSLSFFSPGF